MKTLFISLIILILALLVSCKKINQEELTGTWKVIEHAKYADGETPEFQVDLPYWLLLRYAQGVQINNNGTLLHRFSSNGSSWTTSPNDSYGTWELSKNKILFFIDNSQIEVEVVEWKNDTLWIKYKEGDHNLEYKLYKE